MVRHARQISSAGSMALMAITVWLWSSATHAQTSAPTAAPDYHPSLGDLMTMAIQPRHTKLGIAAAAGNWPYAKYELSELRNAFARIARTIPVYRTFDMTAVIGAMTTEPLKAVDQAIEARDARQFKIAYAALTNTCNACHQSQDHAMIVIRVPTANAYPDQDLRGAAR